MMDFELDKKNWKPVTFGEVVREVRETVSDFEAEGIERSVGLEHIDSESLHIRSWGNVGDSATFNRRFRTGQVLFGRRRAYLKKAALADFDGVCSGDITVLEAKPELLLPELLPFLVQNDSFFAYAVEKSAGSLSPRAKFQDLAPFPFLLPPKDQQARLAELLWAGDEVVEGYYNLVDKLQATIDASMQVYFSEPEKYFSEWKIIPLEKVCKFQTGIAKGKKYENEELLEYPYLRVANVQDGYLDLSEIKTIKVTRKEVSRFSLNYNDVLLTEGGDIDKLGRGSVWKSEIEPCLHQNHIFCVRPNEGVLNSEFLSFQTGSVYGKNYFLINAKKTSNLASINSTQVKSFPVILPSFKEQVIVVEKLKAIKNALDDVQIAKINSQSLQKSLLSQIFHP